MDLNPGDLQQGLTIFENHYPPQEEGYAFFRKLVEGVWEQKEAIDRTIRRHSQHWRLDRMSSVDRNILRLAVYELQFEGDTPPKAAINEAIDLGKRFGSEESSAFINGILDSILAEIQTPTPEPGSSGHTVGKEGGAPLSAPAGVKGQPRGTPSRHEKKI
jgi:transcription antitermination protein NusB